MAEHTELKHLIRLLEDESPVVREAVVRELREYGAELGAAIRGERIELTERQRDLLTSFVLDEMQIWLREMWPTWSTCAEDKACLEKALSLLSAYQNGDEQAKMVTNLLNDLGEEFLDRYKGAPAHKLAEFLFKEKGLRGALDDYYRPSNSDIVYVVKEGKGIPISLACIFMLVGKRVDLPVEGCNFPGHFLACAVEDGEARLVDCFDGGRLLTETEVYSLARFYGVPEREVEQMIASPATSKAIVARVLTNLAVAYTHTGEQGRSQLMLELRESVVEEN